MRIITKIGKLYFYEKSFVYIYLKKYHKFSFNTKITSISPTKKSLIHKTPTSSESNIASTISIANNLRINQAKATRAIKTKTLSEHMIHSHSSSTLSALRTAEENIKFSMLSRSKI